MVEFERMSITVKLPFHKEISFGGGQTIVGALDFFQKLLRSKDDYYKREITEVIKVLDKAKRCGSERTSFMIQNKSMHITFEFDKTLDASLFIKLVA